MWVLTKLLVYKAITIPALQCRSATRIHISKTHGCVNKVSQTLSSQDSAYYVSTNISVLFEANIISIEAITIRHQLRSACQVVR